MAPPSQMFCTFFDRFLHHRLRLWHRTQFRRRVSDRSVVLATSCSNVNKTFCGQTPKVNGLLNLERSDTYIHNIKAKRCKVNNDSATYLWHFHLGHIGVKRMKKLHKDGLLESLDYESLDAC